MTLWSQPFAVGPLKLDHRLVVSPHSGGGGLLLGEQAQFVQHCAYWVDRVGGGIQWVGGGPVYVGSPLIPGFDPTGVGAHGPGHFRHPRFSERMSEFMARIHAAGGLASVQMVLQGGSAVAPSPSLSGYNDHRIPHPLSLAEIDWYLEEYAASAALAAEAGADAIELHSNHDDLLQWFLSPRTNTRDDGYGGDFEGRRRFVREIVESIRARVGPSVALGLRLNMDERIPGGYGSDDCGHLLEAFTSEGLVDYFSLDIGDNWGQVTYVPSGVFDEAQWAPLCGQLKARTRLPVVYVGRVTSVAAAERLLTEGHADLVGFARATIADPELVAKTRTGRTNEIRPCLGFNECLDRRVVEVLPFACAANTRAGRESLPAPTPAGPFSALVVGGGPAGTELASLLAEQGHAVELWEREGRIGGQIALAARLRANRAFGAWIDWQEGRLDRAGVKVILGRDATAGEVAGYDADVVAIATGARPRLPDVGGLDRPIVFGLAAAIVAAGSLGRHVLVVAEDDRAVPLALADHLAGAGHEVTVIHQSLAPSPLVGKYTIGALLARLDSEGARLVAATRLVAVEDRAVRLANTYSGREWLMEDVDAVVLATGSVPLDELFVTVRQLRTGVHVLGDAYAPRRMAFATKQAYELAAILAAVPPAKR